MNFLFIDQKFSYELGFNPLTLSYALKLKTLVVYYQKKITQHAEG